MRKSKKKNKVSSYLIMNEKNALKDSIFKIGRVISVKGRAVDIKVDKTKNTSHLLYKGELLKNISVGGYIKIIKGFTKIVGKVEGEYISEDKLFSKKEYGNEKDKISRVLNVSLLGFFGNKGFERGIKELPLIDNECFLLENDEFNEVHDFVKKGDEPITIGTLSLEKGKEINIGVESLFASHIGIFGNTGSGKSYTLAKIYRELFQQYKSQNKFKKNTQFFLIDFNGEYIREDVIVEKDCKNIYELSTREQGGKDKFPISEKNINDHAFWDVFLTATEKTQAPFIKRTLKKEDVDVTKIENVIRNIVTNQDRKIEKGVIFNYLEGIKPFLADEINIGELRSKLKYHATSNTYKIESYYANEQPDDVVKEIRKCLKDENYTFKIKEDLSILQKIHLKIVYYYYNEIERGFSNQEHIGPLISRLDKRINDLEKVIEIKDDGLENFFTIVSLKKVNPDMTKVLPLLMCKQLYDEKKEKSKKNNDSYLNFIIDEAHNILSYSSERESETWKDYRLETFEEIIKEGRKFGVFLTVASQRPSDISSTIISQLHNYFLHRLINNNDILAVEKTISYLDKVSFDYLPILPTGTCILAGLLAQVPVVVDIGKIDPAKHAPDNETMKLIKNWKDSSSKKK